MSFDHGAIVLGAGEGKTISAWGASYTYKADKEDTGGALSAHRAHDRRRRASTSYPLPRNKLFTFWPP